VKALLAAKLGDAREVVIDMPPGMGASLATQSGRLRAYYGHHALRRLLQSHETPGGLLLELGKKPPVAWRFYSTTFRAEVQGI
jgi:hypothetical protein